MAHIPGDCEDGVEEKRDVEAESDVEMDMDRLRNSGEGEGLGAVSDRTRPLDCGAFSDSVTDGGAEGAGISGCEGSSTGEADASGDGEGGGSDCN